MNNAWHSRRNRPHPSAAARLTSALLTAMLAACSPAPDPASTSVDAPGFVGSEQCKTCHTREFELWRGSHHQRAMQVADATTVLGNFADVTVPYFDTMARFFTRDEKHFVEVQNQTGDLQQYQITHTFGVIPLQQYLVDTDNGRKQALQFIWDSRTSDLGGQRWYHLYPDEYVGPDDPLHWTGRYFNWNYTCAECHSTNLRPGYDSGEDAFNTTYSEVSVGCEACHGPGSAHARQAQAGSFDAQRGLAVEYADRAGVSWTMNSRSGIAQRSRPNLTKAEPESCGRCHSRRRVIAANYAYGQPLAETHLVSLLDETLYHADGRIQDEVYVYGSFVQSKMYAAGVTCSDCHDPHSGQLHSGPDPNAICATCHLPSRFATAQHAPLNTGQCVDCHMQATTYMGVDDRRDHSFRLPDAGSAPDHYGQRIAAGRAGDANAALLGGIANLSFPPIARATMLSLLGTVDEPRHRGVLAAQAADADPLVRVGLLRALRAQPPDTVVNTATHLLRDPVRAVRIEAAQTFAPYREALPLDDAQAFARAAQDYRESMLTGAFMPDAAINLAEFESQLGNGNAAAAMYAHAMRTGSDNARVQHAYGLHLVRAGNASAALEHLRRATEIEPGAAWFVYVYGVALNSTGATEEALKVLRAAHHQFPDHFEIGWALITMLRDAGQQEEVGILLAKLQTAFPDNPQLAALARSLR